MCTEMILSSDVSFNLKLKGHNAAVSSLKFRNDQNLLSSGVEPDLFTWNLNTPELRSYKLSNHTGPVNEVDASKNGKLLCSASKDRSVRLWAPTLAGMSKAVITHSKSVTTVNVTNNGRTLLTGSADKSLKLWDVPTLKFKHSLVGHNHFVNSARFSVDSKLILSAGEDKTLKLWDADNQRCIHTFTNFRDSANKIAVFGKYVACALSSGSVRIYDYMQRRLMQHYALTNNVLDFAWHPTGKFAIAGSKNGCLTVLDIMRGKPIFEVDNAHIPVTCVAFSPSGTTFAYGCADGHILVMNCEWDKVTSAMFKADV